jgi:hypothetical protein
MKVNANASKILKQIKDEREANKRGRVTFYLNEKLYADFQKACKGEPASSVIEMLMRDFIANS